MNVFQEFLATQYHYVQIQMGTTTVKVQIPFVTTRTVLYYATTNHTSYYLIDNKSINMYDVGC